MSDRRDSTERHYETPFEHLDREEHAEKAMLGWALRSLRDLGAAIEDLSGRVNALYSNQQGLAETLYRVEQTQRTISRHLAAIRHKEIDEMATLEDVQALVTQTGVDAQETADRVIAAIAAATGDAATTIADLQAQVAALIAGNASDITPEQLQSVADGLTAVDTTIKGIAPAPVVEPPVEPTA